MYDQIPITFEYKGQTYSGHFSQVNGGGSTANFHLMIDSFFYGQLRYTANHGWMFFNNHGQFKELADYFGDYVTAWVQ